MERLFLGVTFVTLRTYVQLLGDVENIVVVVHAIVVVIEVAIVVVAHTVVAVEVVIVVVVAHTVVGVVT